MKEYFMEERRWLLPFTHSLDVHALLVVLNMARAHNVRLIPVSFVPQDCSTGVLRIRPERLQQSKDFLEAIRWRAEQRHVPIECHEVKTTNVVHSIRCFAQEWDCADIVVVMREHTPVFLEFQQMREVCVRPPCALMLLRLPKRREMKESSFVKWLNSWFGWRQDDGQVRSAEAEAGQSAAQQQGLYPSKT